MGEFLLLHVKAVMDHVRVLQELVHGRINSILIIMMIDGGTDQLRLPRIGQLQFAKNLPRQFRAFRRMVVIAAGLLRMHVVKHGSHGT